MNGEGVVGQFLTRSHPFGQCRGKGHDAERHGVLLGRGTFPSAQSGEYVGTEDLLCRIALAVFHCPAIGRGEEQYALVAQQLPQVVVEVARLLFVVEHEEVGGWTFVSCCPQHQCRSRTAQPFEQDGRLPFAQAVEQGAHTGMMSKKREKFGKGHEVRKWEKSKIGEARFGEDDVEVRPSRSEEHRQLLADKPVAIDTLHIGLDVGFEELFEGRLFAIFPDQVAATEAVVGQIVDRRGALAIEEEEMIAADDVESAVVEARCPRCGIGCVQEVVSKGHKGALIAAVSTKIVFLYHGCFWAVSKNRRRAKSA